MKRTCQNLFVLCFAFLVFFALDAGEKSASPLLTYSGAATRPALHVAVDSQDGHDQIETDLEAENRKLKEERHSLRQQNQVLIQVSESYKPFLPLQRERELLKTENEFLEKQNRILAEFCPILKEAACQEFSGGCDPDVAVAWGVD